MKGRLVCCYLSLFLMFMGKGKAIEIVLDFTLDEQNYNWFNPSTSLGQERRASLQAAAGFSWVQ